MEKLFENHFKKIAPKSVKIKVTAMHGGEAALTPMDSPGVKAAAVAIKKRLAKNLCFSEKVVQFQL